MPPCKDPILALAERTALVDGMVQRSAGDKLWPAFPAGLTLLAVGGYGRRHLFPYSDVDLLLLVESGRLAQEAADGHRPCRLKALAERVRDEAGCRLNNIYVAYIGRELVQELPVLQPLVTFRKTAVERDKFPHQWLSQVNAPRRIPTARPWPSGGSCDRQAGR